MGPSRVAGRLKPAPGIRRFLLSLRPSSVYLAAASETIAPDPAARRAWMETQKEALKGGRLDAVLRALARHREPPRGR